MGGSTGIGLGLPGSCGCSMSSAETCVDDVLQLEHLLGGLVLVVPQLEHLLVGWALEVVQQVPHEAD